MVAFSKQVTMAIEDDQTELVIIRIILQET